MRQTLRADLPPRGRHVSGAGQCRLHQALDGTLDARSTSCRAILSGHFVGLARFFHRSNRKFHQVRGESAIIL
jgi:hypothetical protein